MDELKKYVRSEQLVIGTEKTMKLMRLGQLSKVFLSKNAPQAIVDDFNHYSKLNSVPVVQLDMPNDELGTFCKKPFSISVLGIKK